jgi:hypothetical protein
MSRRPDGPVDGDDPSLPASATITTTHRYGRVLSGWPLAAVVATRNLVLELVASPVPAGDAGEVFGPPQYLIFRDKNSGRRLGRLALGREDVDAHGRRVTTEYDLDVLDREQFLSKHLRG